MNLVKVLKARKERLRGFILGISLMLLDELFGSALMANENASYPLPCSTWTASLFSTCSIPVWNLWQVVFAVLALLFMFS